MVIHDKKLIKKLRYKGGALRRNPSKVKIRFCEKIAQEHNLLLETVRYYMFKRKPQKIYDRTYDLKYKRLIRHIDSVFPQIFNGKPELSLNEISDRIENSAGIYLKEKTLERLLAGYEGKPRGPPILKTESGNYRLNDSYYRSQN